MRALLTPKWVLSHLFVLAMVVLMVGLGFWQLDRLGDRKDRNDEVRAALEAEPEDLGVVLGEGRTLPDHHAVVVRGEYLDELSFLVANRSIEAQAGSWLVTPVELDDGTVVVVGRGWVPRRWTAGEDPRDLGAPAGPVEVRGRAFRSVDGGRIGTGDVAVLREISRLDLDTVRELLGVDVAPLWVQLGEQTPPAGELPIPVPPASLDEGPHLSYAFQWFFFSVGTVVAYGLILRRQLRPRLEEATV